MGRVAGQGGRLGLLGLQEQDLVLDAALEQEDPGPGADAAHPDHLVGDVGQAEVVQQVPPVGWEGAAFCSFDSRGVNVDR